MKKLSEMTRSELRVVLGRVQAALWPSGNAEHEWSPDTIDEVARALLEADLAPSRRRNSP